MKRVVLNLSHFVVDSLRFRVITVFHMNHVPGHWDQKMSQ